MSQVMKEEQPVYHRILLKLSGESLGANGLSIDPDILSRVAGEITGCIELGVQVALVIGGGNIYRGAELEKAGLNRVIGDQMGMLATVMNGLAMADTLHHFGVHSTLMCAVEIEGVAKRFNWNDGRRALNDGRVVICSGGTGNPFFTTDTAACLRGAELGVQAVFKGTRVDGVYSADPEKDSSAVLYKKLSFDEVLKKELKVMDLTAFALARDHKLPIRVYNMTKTGALHRILVGGDEGTLVTDEA